MSLYHQHGWTKSRLSELVDYTPTLTPTDRANHSAIDSLVYHHQYWLNIQSEQPNVTASQQILKTQMSA